LSGDDADLADAQIEIFRAQAERRAAGKSGPEKHPEFDGESCVDCGIEIPKARLALCKVRCVDCQTLLEKKR